MPVTLVLASGSPRRRTLIGLLGLAWRATAADVDETAALLADPFVSALNVAAAKASAVGGTGQAHEVLVAADTLVVADGAVLGKPADAEAAQAMLRALRGQSHTVLTGVVLQTGSDRQQWGAVVSTRVEMRDYAAADIDAYVARGEPFDKAGGYAIQDRLFRPVERIDGCYLNVVGLPLCAVSAGLAALGIPLPLAPEAELLPPCTFCRRGADLVGS